MKRLILILIILCVPSLVFADNVTLNSDETVVSAVSAKNITAWHISYLSQADKRCTVRLKWTTATGQVINVDGSKWGSFDCINHKKEDGTQIENSECTATGFPYPCCTANNDGVCKCFNDVFGYQLQASDAGTAIGIKQRNLLWSQAKKKLLSTGNDGTFQ